MYRKRLIYTALGSFIVLYTIIYIFVAKPFVEKILQYYEENEIKKEEYRTNMDIIDSYQANSIALKDLSTSLNTLLFDISDTHNLPLILYDIKNLAANNNLAESEIQVDTIEDLKLEVSKSASEFYRYRISAKSTGTYKDAMNYLNSLQKSKYTYHISQLLIKPLGESAKSQVRLELKLDIYTVNIASDIRGALDEKGKLLY